MAGPAMIEGGGLGVVRADEIGPSDVQAGTGVIDGASLSVNARCLPAFLFLLSRRSPA